MKENTYRLKHRVRDIIFESDTRAGRAFDVVLILIILFSVAVVMLESVAQVREEYGALLRAAEWLFTILFTIEYVLRLVTIGRPLNYALSFFGIVDFLAIIPTYLSVLVPGAQYFLVIRMLRILRVFRVLKLARYMEEAGTLTKALAASRRKIEVFTVTVVTLVVIFGSLMYFVEGAENGFTSIPTSVYWAIVTLTTVGYGDISPQTGIGQALAALIMIMGYGIIAVPTGIVTSELARSSQRSDAIASSRIFCPACGAAGHDLDASFCKHCGEKLPQPGPGIYESGSAAAP